jgi:S1-C subfamily serine protease
MNSRRVSIGRAGLATAVLAVVLAAVVVRADDEPPLLRPEDRMALARQAEELGAAASQATRDAGRSVVWVWQGRVQRALGTVVGDGTRAVTKWSELAGTAGPLRCVTADGRTLRAKVLGVYADDDLAVLAFEDGKLPPVKWSSAPPPPPGRFVVAALPDGRAGAIGVVSVPERSLRESDQAFLGVEQDPGYQGPGIRVARVVEGSGSEQAGLRPGDVVLRVGGRQVGGLFELRTALIDLAPGETAKLWVLRRGEEFEVSVTLGRRPAFPQFPAQRLRQMERMAGDKGLSRLGDGFPQVIESDIKIWPEHCGAPAVDLDGRVVGVVIARATRTRSFVIPAARVIDLLKQDPGEPVVAAAEPAAHGRSPAPPAARRGPRPGPEALDRRRARVDEMRMFMERFLEEMEALEER